VNSIECGRSATRHFLLSQPANEENDDERLLQIPLCLLPPFCALLVELESLEGLGVAEVTLLADLVENLSGRKAEKRSVERREREREEMEETHLHLEDRLTKRHAVGLLLAVAKAAGDLIGLPGEAPNSSCRFTSVSACCRVRE
jgi:hypothetical protein